MSFAGKSTIFEKESSPRERLSLLDRGESRRSSWCITEREFAPILERLRTFPPGLTREEGLINESSGKYVWKIEYDAPEGKKVIAYKTNPGKTPHRYIFQSSLPIREMRNYLLFEELGLPVARVLAAGDVRKNFILKETFIATEFLENSRDGRQFMPGGSCRMDRENRMVFCRRNLELLARIHHAGVFHKAFHPRNLLWRGEGDSMEIFWIDVARCRKVPERKMPAAIIKDLHTFFRDMLLAREEVEELLAYYISLAPGKYLPASREELLEKLIHFRRRLFTRKRYRLFGEE